MVIALLYGIIWLECSELYGRVPLRCLIIGGFLRKVEEHDSIGNNSFAWDLRDLTVNGARFMI